MKKACTYCLNDGKLQVCSKCKSAYYCNQNCQRLDWSIHKIGCEQYQLNPGALNTLPILKEITNNFTLFTLLSLDVYHNTQKNVITQQEYFVICKITKYLDKSNFSMDVEIIDRNNCLNNYKPDNINFLLGLNISSGVNYQKCALVTIPIETIASQWLSMGEFHSAENFPWPPTVSVIDDEIDIQLKS